MARERGNDDGSGSGSGAMTSSTLWWGAGGLIVLVLIGLVWVLINRGGSTPGAVATHTVTATAPAPNGGGAPPTGPASTSTSAGNTSGCDVPGGNTLVPTSAIPATWQLVGSMTAPVSVFAGPKKITGPEGTLRSCYQDSPTGAVIAAINISVALNSPSEQEVISRQYTTGPGMAQAAALPADSGNASISGFQAQACTQSACLVKVAATVQGSYVEQTMPMIWAAGDWKVNGQVTGVAQPVEVSSLSPYVAMNAQGVS